MKKISFLFKVIEGNSIETLLHIYNDQSNFIESTHNSPKVTENSKSSTSSANIKKSSQTFNFTDFSFNLLYKLCYDYPNCRSEFGRVGGLVKILNKIEAYHAPDQTAKNITQQEYEKLVEMICLSCKEVTNRSRLREQGFLINLVKHQQKLFKLNLNYTSKSSRGSFESKLHNKLLVALCYFVYDQDSLNVLLSNGLMDSLLAYLNESLTDINDENENKRARSVSPSSNSQNCRLQFESLFQDSNKKLVSLRNLLILHKSSSKEIENSTNRKRKSPDLNETKNSSVTTKPKRRKQSELSPPPPPLTPTFPTFLSPSHQPARIVSPNSFSPEFQFIADQRQSTSPTGSYCSLSPQPNAFSPALSLSSPTQLPPRSHSAIMFSNTCQNQTYQNSFSASNLAFSPCSSSNELSLSPYLYSPNSFNEVEQQMNNTNIQFSPSIKNENSSDEEIMDDDEEDSDDQKDNDRQTDAKLGIFLGYFNTYGQKGINNDVLG